MYFPSLQIPLGVACILAICATGHPVQVPDTDIKARWPGWTTDDKNPLDIKITYFEPPSGKASDLVLQVTLTNNRKQNMQLLEDKNSVLYGPGPVDALIWQSGLYGIPQFKGESTDTDTKIDPTKVLSTLKKGASRDFQYKAGDSYSFAKVRAGTYTASLKQPWFWVKLDGGKVDKVYVPEVDCRIPIVIAPKKEDSVDI